MVHLTILAEEKTVFQQVVPIEFLVRTKKSGVTFLMINGRMIHNIVAFKAEQQVGVTIQPPPALTLWIQKPQEASMMRTLKVLMATPVP